MIGTYPSSQSIIQNHSPYVTQAHVNARIIHRFIMSYSPFVYSSLEVSLRIHARFLNRLEIRVIVDALDVVYVLQLLYRPLEC